MSENKTAKIPVASHGLHAHSYNYPWLSSINFGDVMPCYINPIRKGERDSPKAGVYSQLMPIAHNAFATGRYNFKAVFVPYKLVWRPWYAFDQQTYYYTEGNPFRPGVYPFITQGVLTSAICSNSNYATLSTQASYDVVYGVTSGGDYVSEQFYLLTPAGRRIVRILGALGCMPSFISTDTRTLNILAVMCYIKAFADYYFPNNYVGNREWNVINKFFDRDAIDFNSQVDTFLDALDICSRNYYENSVFDIGWDNPVSPNSAFPSPNVTIKDVTDPDGDLTSHATNNDVANHTPSMSSESNAFTQYTINALKSLSMWMKRRQLSGARLIDKFLVSRGLTLPNDSAKISYLLGQRNIEIEVSGVENNTDTNLGELAGRGVASSGNSPLSFECSPDDDGVLFVIVSPIPDANFPILVDGFSVRKDFMDNYNAEYDKLGAAVVPSVCMQQTVDGHLNFQGDPNLDGTFCFLNRYWDEVQERPRLLGDFLLPSRGAVELQAYHTFRVFSTEGLANGLFHSYDFQAMKDNEQFQRLFYSDKQENLMLFLRWFGKQYKEKLPLGDSYDWDDDELNRKVSVVVGGSQK